jgi:hypothetical protein
LESKIGTKITERLEKASNMRYILLVLTVVLLSACAVKVTDTRTGQSGYLKTHSRLLEVTCDPPPKWVTTPPEPDDKNVYTVGGSKYFYEKETAKDSALLDATAKFVEFCGVEVRKSAEQSETSAGKSSSIFDPYVKTTTRIKGDAKALIGKVQPVDYYIKKHGNFSGTTLIDAYYEVLVLASLPKDEVESVRQQLLVAKSKTIEETIEETPLKQDKKNIDAVEIAGFTLKVQECKLSGGNLTCYLLVTNNREDDDALSFLLQTMWGTTRFIDSSGNEFKASSIKIGADQGSAVEKTFVPGVPMKVMLLFENIPVTVNFITLLEVVFFDRKPISGQITKAAKFRNIPLEK